MSDDHGHDIDELKDFVKQLQGFMIGRCSKCQREVKILAVTLRLVPSFGVEFVLAPHTCRKQAIVT